MIKINEKEFTFTLEDYAGIMMEIADGMDCPLETPSDWQEEQNDLVKMFLIMANTAIDKANFPAKTVFVNTIN